MENFLRVFSKKSDAVESFEDQVAQDIFREDLPKDINKKDLALTYGDFRFIFGFGKTKQDFQDKYIGLEFRDVYFPNGKSFLDYDAYLWLVSRIKVKQ